MNTSLESIVEMFGFHFAIIKEYEYINMCFFFPKIILIPNVVTNFDVFTLADGS